MDVEIQVSATLNYAEIKALIDLLGGMTRPMYRDAQVSIDNEKILASMFKSLDDQLSEI
jgi:hypothetical protein